MKVALVGYGHLGKWHAQKSYKVFGTGFNCVVEPDQDKHRQILEEYPHLQVFQKIEDVLNLIDALVIATPTKFHFQDLQKGINSGKHIFCEKPLTDTYEETKKIHEMLKDKNICLQVGHSERFHRCWDELDELGNLSEASILRLNRLAPYKGRGIDVDIIHDLMIHDFDLLNFQLNKMPVEVESFGKKVISSNYDYVTTVLTYSSGQKAFVTASRVNNLEVRGLEAVMPDGVLEIDLLNNMIYRSYFDSRSNIEKSYEKRDHLLIEQEEFFNSIDKKTSPIVDIVDAEKAMKIIDAAQSSLKLNKPIKF